MKLAPIERRLAIRKRNLKVGDYARVARIPKGLSDSAHIGTPRVFRQALGKAFKIQGFNDYGFVELKVSKGDTIWIEPEFLVREERKPKLKQD